MLVESGLGDDQNLAYIEQTQKATYLVRYSNSVPFGSMRSQVRYQDSYWDQRQHRAFSILMLDGALIQISYEFKAGRLLRHRLAFLPSPDLLDYQNYPELYSEERLFVDVVDKGVVTVPVRFDYDARTGVQVVLEHPESHLTLGQYSGCRIPVTAGVTPHSFMQFVLSSFYRTGSESVSLSLPSPRLRFERCIQPPELRVVYVGVPTHL